MARIKDSDLDFYIGLINAQSRNTVGSYVWGSRNGYYVLELIPFGTTYRIDINVGLSKGQLYEQLLTIQKVLNYEYKEKGEN